MCVGWTTPAVLQNLLPLQFSGLSLLCYGKPGKQGKPKKQKRRLGYFLYISNIFWNFFRCPGDLLRLWGFKFETAQSLQSLHENLRRFMAVIISDAFRKALTPSGYIVSSEFKWLLAPTLLPPFDDSLSQGRNGHPPRKGETQVCPCDKHNLSLWQTPREEEEGSGAGGRKLGRRTGCRRVTPRERKRRGNVLGVGSEGEARGKSGSTQ